MTANSFSEMCKAIAPSLGNHVWQSTLFAIVAGLLTLLLRNNHARTRYWLWLTASIKFLIPFSLLAGLGSHIAWWRNSAGANSRVYFAVDQFSQPFSPSRLSLISQAPPSTHPAALLDLLPTLLAVAWLCGIAVVVLAWYMRWRRISAVMRKAAPLREGREVEGLRRLERAAGISRQIEMRLSQTALEPGIFGIMRPILVWPHGISAPLSDAHLDSILAHELCHVRRRDNLTAGIHMLVVAIFCFHPMLWWMGGRLLEERERACDEQVLEMGSDRQIYAESILKICEFCVQSPLDFVSGVTGADLKKRIVHIMAKNSARNLDFSRKLLLTVAGFLAVVLPVVFGLLNATRATASQAHGTAAAVPLFGAVSIKPSKAINGGVGWLAIDQYTATGITLQTLIHEAYGLQDEQVAGAPSWLNTEKFDVEANVDSSVADQLHRLNFDQFRLESQHMLQALLADRFKLASHTDAQQLPYYALVISKGGLKLHEAKPGDTYPNGIKDLNGKGHGDVMSIRKGQLVGQGIPIADVVELLSQLQLGRIVLDKTGLRGKYDFTLQWTAAPPPDSNSALFTAIQEQLGLELEAQKGPVEVLVIDHVEKPVEAQSQNAPAPAPSFQSVSVKANTTNTPMAGFSIKGKDFSAALFKPDRFMATNYTLHQFIRLAYGVQDSQIVGGPDWINSEKYDVDARLDRSVVDELNGLGAEQGGSERLRMIQSLLADHFKLALHRETKELPAYALIVGDGGPKLQTAKAGDTYPDGIKGPGGRPVGTGYFEPEKGKIIFQGRPLSSLVQYLSDRLGRTVVDKTGLNGNYDFALQWAPASPEASSPSIMAAVQEQLGLKLESQNTATEVLLIDHAEKPSEN